MIEPSRIYELIESCNCNFLECLSNAACNSLKFELVGSTSSVNLSLYTTETIGVFLDCAVSTSCEI